MAAPAWRSRCSCLDAVALMTHALGFLRPPSATQEIRSERSGACHSNRRCQLVHHAPLPSSTWINNGLTKNGTEAIWPGFFVSNIRCVGHGATAHHSRSGRGVRSGVSGAVEGDGHRGGCDGAVEPMAKSVRRKGHRLDQARLSGSRRCSQRAPYPTGPLFLPRLLPRVSHARGVRQGYARWTARPAGRRRKGGCVSSSRRTSSPVPSPRGLTTGNGIRPRRCCKKRAARFLCADTVEKKNAAPTFSLCISADATVAIFPPGPTTDTVARVARLGSARAAE